MIKYKIKNNKKLIAIISAIIGVITILLITFCFVKSYDKNLTVEQKELKRASKNTSISSKGVQSYRVNVIFINKKDSKLNQNYIVYNYNNQNYSITLFDGTESKNYIVKKGETSKDLKYDYTNTDLFLEGFEKGKNIKTENKTISNQKYKLFTFDIDSDVVNNILKPFDVSTNLLSRGSVYVDSNNNVYLIRYDNEDINISVSYTRLNQINK